MKYGELYKLLKEARANNIALINYRFRSSAGWLVEIRRDGIKGGYLGQFDPQSPNTWEWRFNYETIMTGEGMDSLVKALKQFT